MSHTRSREDVLSDITSARTRLAQLEAELASLSSNSPSSQNPSTSSAASSNGTDAAQRNEKDYPLSLREYKRYGRQMLITPVGLPGELFFLLPSSRYSEADKPS